MNEDWLQARGLPSLAETSFAMSRAGAFDGIEEICEALARVPELSLTSFTIMPLERHAESYPYDVYHSGLSHYFFAQSWSNQLATLSHSMRRVKQFAI